MQGFGDAVKRFTLKCPSTECPAQAEAQLEFAKLRSPAHVELSSSSPEMSPLFQNHNYLKS